MVTIIPSQFLYDLRTLTGFMSGNDLHELFRQLVGEPSPRGRVEFALERAFELSPPLVAIMNNDQWGAQAEEYSEAVAPAHLRCIAPIGIEIGSFGMVLELMVAEIEAEDAR